jgi:hypothetical protein
LLLIDVVRKYINAEFLQGKKDKKKDKEGKKKKSKETS